MIINKPVIKKKGKFIFLSSKIEIESDSSLSTEIWYRFPLCQKNFISDRSDAFLVGLFFLGMKINEDITVKGIISPKLLYNLNQVQRYFKNSFPNEFSIIKINCENLKEDLGEKGAIVSSFSGGVDSFYTLLANTKNVPKRDKITHSVFIGGFDLKTDDEYLPQVKKHYEKLLASINVKLLTVDTNLKMYLDEQVSQVRAFGAILTSIFLTLSKNISRVYIASAYQYRDLLPFKGAAAVADGSNPISDHMFSTETTTFVHHDCSISRIDKTKEISKWPITYDSLRVCWRPAGLKNCSECSKCLRTMLTLQLINELEKYDKSFQLPLTKNRMKNWSSGGKDRGFVKEIRSYAKSIGRQDVVLQMNYIIYLKPKLDKLRVLNYFYKQSSNLKNRSKTYKSIIRMMKKNLNLAYN